MSQHYAYIAVQKSHSTLGFYHGTSLKDPYGRFEGTGKNLRHVKVREMSQAKDPAIETGLIEAIADRRRYANDASQEPQNGDVPFCALTTNHALSRILFENSRTDRSLWVSAKRSPVIFVNHNTPSSSKKVSPVTHAAS
jgi:hypothetical protein